MPMAEVIDLDTPRPEVDVPTCCADPGPMRKVRVNGRNFVLGPLFVLDRGLMTHVQGPFPSCRFCGADFTPEMPTRPWAWGADKAHDGAIMDLVKSHPAYAEKEKPA